MDTPRSRRPAVLARRSALWLALLATAAVQAADPPRGETLSLRVDVDMTPELGRRLTEHLRDLLINHVGDASDDEGWDAATAPLDALMARAFDRGLHPFAEMVDVSGEDLWEDFVTFGKAWPVDQPALSRYGPDTTASDLIDKYVEPAYADLMNLASKVEGAETSAALQSAMLMSELSKELHRLLPDRSDGTVSP